MSHSHKVLARVQIHPRNPRAQVVRIPVTGSQRINIPMIYRSHVGTPTPIQVEKVDIHLSSEIRPTGIQDVEGKIKGSVLYQHPIISD
ncbi:MAG: hypothetical protein BWY82_02517 [Verrucomicrobia bacterium ADurb.Bin474]|nr:MAG: hypothetical protein BWY82_02517 [Verrucomicrobia bacterium ADurb.Bin474]